MQMESYGSEVANPSTCTGLPRRANGLAICIDTYSSGSILQASVSTSHGLVSVSLGLAGDGIVARTVFNSLARVT